MYISFAILLKKYNNYNIANLIKKFNWKREYNNIRFLSYFVRARDNTYLRNITQCYVVRLPRLQLFDNISSINQTFAPFASNVPSNEATRRSRDARFESTWVSRSVAERSGSVSIVHAVMDEVSTNGRSFCGKNGIALSRPSHARIKLPRQTSFGRLAVRATRRRRNVDSERVAHSVGVLPSVSLLAHAPALIVYLCVPSRLSPGEPREKRDPRERRTSSWKGARCLVLTTLRLAPIVDSRYQLLDNLFDLMPNVKRDSCFLPKTHPSNPSVHNYLYIYIRCMIYTIAKSKFWNVKNWNERFHTCIYTHKIVKLVNVNMLVRITHVLSSSCHFDNLERYYCLIHYYLERYWYKFVTLPVNNYILGFMYDLYLRER